MLHRPNERERKGGGGGGEENLLFVLVLKVGHVYFIFLAQIDCIPSVTLFALDKVNSSRTY